MMNTPPHSNYLTVGRQFSLEMAHFLARHEGPCRHIHGHSYTLLVEITGPVKDQIEASTDGMIIDYQQLKHIVTEVLLEPFDHALVYDERSALAQKLQSLSEIKQVALPMAPTCENLIRHFARLLLPGFPEAVLLQKLTLYETEKNFATWYA